METHPVPQNVTSFEFHLIGDMTIKQFCYLATGLAIAYVTYLTLATSALWFALPVIIISAGTGAAFAFLPFQDRPLDHWAGAFFKAVYSPTQFKWHASVDKKQGSANEVLLYQKRLQLYLSNAAATATPAPTAQPVTAAQTTSAAPTQAPQVAQRPARPVFNENLFNKTGAPLIAPPSDDKLQKTVDLAKEAQQIQTQIVQAEKQMEVIKNASSQPGVEPGAYAADLQKVFNNLQTLIQSSQAISTQMGQLTPQPVHTPSPQPAAVQPAPSVPKTRRILPSLTSQPNVINGIVTDAAGNYLENVVVVIHNSDGLPVRALKTNKLGQFTGATPLPDGPYNLSLEKDTLEFDPIKVDLSGKVMEPLEVSAKRGATVTA